MAALETRGHTLCVMCSEWQEYPSAFMSEKIQKRILTCCKNEDEDADVLCDLCFVDWSKIFKTCQEHGVKSQALDKAVRAVVRNKNAENNESGLAISDQWNFPEDLKFFLERIYNATTHVFQWNDQLQTDLIQAIQSDSITTLTELKNFVESHSSNPVIEEEDEVMAEVN